MRTMSERTEAKWLRGLDLPADGSPIFVYVHAVWAEQVRNPQTDQTEEQTIVSFADDHGNLVLKPYIFSGQENATRMGLEVANNPEDWPGTYVRLWAVDTRNPKTRQPARGIRIGAAHPKPTMAEQRAAVGPKPLPPIVTPPTQPVVPLTTEQLTVPVTPQKRGREDRGQPSAPPADGADDLSDSIPF